MDKSTPLKKFLATPLNRTLYFKLVDFKQIQVNESTGADFSGTSIESNKPVAIIVGAGLTITKDSLGVNHCTDMLLPVNQLTNEYFALHSPYIQKDDYIRITGRAFIGL